MNILFRMEKGIAVCLFSSFFVLACVSHIPGEKAAVSNGDIPLKFIADKPKVGVNIRLLQLAWSVDDETLRNKRAPASG